MGIYCRKGKDGAPVYYLDYYDPGQVDPKTGGPHRVRVKHGTNKNAAAKELAARLGTIATSGTLLGILTQESPAFEKWTKTYIENFCGRNAKNTIEAKRRMVIMLNEYFGRRRRLRINGVTPLHVAGYVKWRLEQGHRLYPGRSVGPRTVNLELGLLTHIWHCAKRERLAVGDTPVTQDCYLPEVKREPCMLTEPMFQGLLSICGNHDARRCGDGADLRDFVLFIRYTGCRVGEVLGLQTEHINHVLEEFTFKDTKNKESRTIPLVPHLAEILNRQEPVKGYVFGGPSHRNRIRLAWERARSKAGLDHVHLHDIRHMASTLMQTRGVDLLSCESLLGHKVRGMAGYYGHATRDGLKNALLKLAEPFPTETGVVTNRSQNQATVCEGENEPPRNILSIG